MKKEFLSFDGKNLILQNIRVIRKKIKKKKTQNQIYNHEELFDYFIKAGGVPSSMIKAIEMLPEDLRGAYPCKAQIYNIIKRENFIKRYEQIYELMKLERQKEVGMSAERLDQAAKFAILRYLEGLGSKDKSKQIKVGIKDVKGLWEITRTERGLVTNITQQQSTGIESGVKRIFEQRGLGDLVNAFKNLPVEVKDKLLNNNNENGAGEPKLLTRD